MATLNMTDQMTAIELARRANNPDAFKVIEIMQQTNEFLLDAPAHEANNSTTNTTIQRITEEAGEHRVYNQGVRAVATQTFTTEDRIAVLEAFSNVDKDMADHSGNVNAVRQSEAIPIMKGMGLTQARTILYGNFQRDKAEFDGLFTRRNSLKYKMPDGSLIDNPYVFDAGGTGPNLTSVYLVAFGQENLSMIYPRGSGGSVGVSREDMTGPEGRLITDPRQAGKEYRVYTEFFKAQYGIVVKNPAALIRIANIPASMTGDAIVDKILEAGYSMVSGASTYCMYSNKDIMIKIDKAARDKGNVVYYAEDPWGRKITYVRDFRCRRMDVITNNEAQVTAA